MSKVKSTKRKFRVSPNVIMSLINHQAGSMEKAILEAVSNSMDAHANRIEVSISKDKIIISDDGIGIRNEDEIEDFFENFGFDHTNLDRGIGRFGIGRGQMFGFGVNEWRTSSFKMKIDIRKNGLDYDLSSDLPHHQGMEIKISLHEKINFSEQMKISQALREMLEYSHTPIYINGEKINIDYTKVKWEGETEEAFFTINPASSYVKVYSQGVKVRNFNSYEYGVGGMIVSKPGCSFNQNMARNDILVKECDIWKKVNAHFKKLTLPYKEKSASRSTSMTEAMRRALALDAMEPDGFKVLSEQKIFTTTNQKHVNLNYLIKNNIWTFGADHDAHCDKLNHHGGCVALSASTLERFGVSNMMAFKKLIQRLLEEQEEYCRVEGHWQQEYKIKDMIAKHTYVEAYENHSEVPIDTSINPQVIQRKDLKEKEQAALYVLRQQLTTLNYYAKTMIQEESEEEMPVAASYAVNIPRRQLHVFEGEEHVNAFTDGHKYIYLNRFFLNSCIREGISGFIKMMHILFHEHLHESESLNSHSHPAEFYQMFHEAVIEKNIAGLGLYAYSQYVKKGPGIARHQLSSFENTMHIFIDEPIFTKEALEPETDCFDEMPYPVKPGKKISSKKSNKTPA